MNLDTLESLAKAATPGPWKFYTRPQPNGCPIIGNSRGLMVAMLSHSINQADQKSEALANAAFISTANPQTILALIALLREMGECLLHCYAETDARINKRAVILTKFKEMTNGN